jgi:cysteinylglycine-S-conjugate dipeptidase
VSEASNAIPTGVSGSGAAAEIVAAVMPSLRSDLDDLVRIPSVSAPGRIDAALREAHDLVAHLFSEAGVQVERLDLPGTAPVVVGHIPPPPGAPTVLLYSHYDVAPAGDENHWASPPFEPTERDGAIFGRGTADTKCNVIAHLGALRAWEGRPPVGIKICIEGHQEIGSGALSGYPATDPERFRADALLIGAMGSLTPGIPTLTVALRGMAQVFLEVPTARSGRPRGRHGAAAPDALLALLHAMATLHDGNGDVCVAGLRRTGWDGVGSRIRPGPAIIGPAITVTGIDAPPVDTAANAAPPRPRALLDIRIHPEQDAGEAQAAVIHHLRDLRPFGNEIEVRPGPTGDGFAAVTTGPAYDAARVAWSEAWGAEVRLAGSGESIPIVSALTGALPDAEVLLVGATDGDANIHGPNERVLLSEFEKAVVAEAKFFREFAEHAAAGQTRMLTPPLRAGPRPG